MSATKAAVAAGGVMDAMRRTFDTLLVPSGYKRSLLLATYDDNIGVKDSEMQAVLEGLLGCDAKVKASDAIDAIPQRLRESWTWRVVLKTLLVLHYTVTSPATTAAWLSATFSKLEVFKICQSFREGEGVDAQAESHTKIIRRLAKYLEELCRHVSTPESENSKIAYKKTVRLAPNMFGLKEDEDLFRAVVEINRLLTSCLSVVQEDDDTINVIGFCDLTATIFRSIFKDALQLYGFLSAAGAEVVERYHRFHPADIPAARRCHTLYREATKRVQTLSSFLRTFPDGSFKNSPTFDSPPATTLLSDEAADKEDRSSRQRRHRRKAEEENDSKRDPSISSSQSSLSSHRATRSRHRRKRSPSSHNREAHENSVADVSGGKSPHRTRQGLARSSSNSRGRHSQRRRKSKPRSHSGSHDSLSSQQTRDSNSKKSKSRRIHERSSKPSQDRHAAERKRSRRRSGSSPSSASSRRHRRRRPSPAQVESDHSTSAYSSSSSASRSSGRRQRRNQSTHGRGAGRKARRKHSSASRDSHSRESDLKQATRGSTAGDLLHFESGPSDGRPKQRISNNNRRSGPQLEEGRGADRRHHRRRERSPTNSADYSPGLEPVTPPALAELDLINLLDSGNPTAAPLASFPLKKYDTVGGGGTSSSSSSSSLDLIADLPKVTSHRKAGVNLAAAGEGNKSHDLTEKAIDGSQQTSTFSDAYPTEWESQRNHTLVPLNPVSNDPLDLKSTGGAEPANKTAASVEINGGDLRAAHPPPPPPSTGLISSIPLPSYPHATHIIHPQQSSDPGLVALKADSRGAEGNRGQALRQSSAGPLGLFAKSAESSRNECNTGRRRSQDVSNSRLLTMRPTTAKWLDGGDSESSESSYNQTTPRSEENDEYSASAKDGNKHSGDDKSSSRQHKSRVHSNRRGKAGHQEWNGNRDPAGDSNLAADQSASPLIDIL